MPETLLFLLRLPRSIYVCLAVLYMAGIYYLSSISISFEDTSYPTLWSFCSNLFHFPLYAGLGVLLLLGLRSNPMDGGSGLDHPTLWRGMIVLSLYAVFDEFHQSWTDRTSSVIDVVADVNGGLCSLFALKFLLDQSFRTRSFILLFAGTSVIACCLAFLGVIL
jgi:VanZ family protein